MHGMHSAMTASAVPHFVVTVALKQILIIPSESTASAEERDCNMLQNVTVRSSRVFTQPFRALPRLLCSNLKGTRCAAPTCSRYLERIKHSNQQAGNMKNGVFWDITPCGSCKNRRFGGT
jgi:hypothetical protein